MAVPSSVLLDGDYVPSRCLSAAGRGDEITDVELVALANGRRDVLECSRLLCTARLDGRPPNTRALLRVLDVLDDALAQLR